jgi:hypothetical protein
MSVEQCKTANWFNVGEKDGSAGRESRLDQYYSSCQKANITPNQNLYEKGYQKGLNFYCRPETIFDEALKDVVIIVFVRLKNVIHYVHIIKSHMNTTKLILSLNVHRQILVII